MSKLFNCFTEPPRICNLLIHAQTTTLSLPPSPQQRENTGFQNVGARNLPSIQKMQSHLHFAPSTRTISAEHCKGQIQNAISPLFRSLDAGDLRRGFRGKNPKRNLTCISRPRHARAPQRVARDKSKTRSHRHFAPSTCMISAEGCTGQIQNAISPAFSRPRHARSPQSAARDKSKT